MSRRPETLVLILLATAAALAGCFGKGGGGATPGANEQLHSAYDDQPFMGGQVTEDHEWSFTDSTWSRIAFLHWMPREGDHDPEGGIELFAVGDGFKGKPCLGEEGVTESEIAAGYVHFHKETAASWDEGHGGDHKDQMGYWLRHIAIKGGIEMMGPGQTVPGEVYRWRDTSTNLPAC